MESPSVPNEPSSVTLETPKPGFDLDMIFNELQYSNFMHLKLYRKDRKAVSLCFGVYSCYNGGQNICATTNNNQFSFYHKYTTAQDLKSEIALFLPILYERINLAKECQYCDALFIDEKNQERKLCSNCISWGCVTQKETCIICSKSEYPTKFKCFTCIDSVICLKCCSNPLFKNQCPTCTKKAVKFGTKRVRDEEDSDSDGED
jgi:hypothetical protein